MTDAHQFTIDTGRGYEVTGRAEVDGDLFDIALSRADGQPFANGQTEFSVTLSIDEDLTRAEQRGGGSAEPAGPDSR